jgi:hypothetical protein
VVVIAATSATTFVLPSTDAGVAPQAGNTIAFFDLPNLRFRRKRILTATFRSDGNYDVVCDTSNGASDLGYTPVVGQPCSPWSDSLDLIVPALLAYTDTLGPGEQVPGFFDPGLRQRRSPPATSSYPNTITNKILAQEFASTSVGDIVLQEPTVPYATPVGVQGVSSNLLTLGGLAVFPQ